MSGPSLCRQNGHQSATTRTSRVRGWTRLVLQVLQWIPTMNWSGEEAGIPATPSGQTLAASRLATNLLSCQRGPTLEHDPVRCRFAANFVSVDASTSPDMAIKTRQPLGNSQAKGRPGSKKRSIEITKAGTLKQSSHSSNAHIGRQGDGMKS